MPDIRNRTTRPQEGEVIGYTATGEPILRYSDTIPLPDTKGKVEELALYAGQSVGLVNNLNPSTEIINQLKNASNTELSTIQILSNFDRANSTLSGNGRCFLFDQDNFK